MKLAICPACQVVHEAVGRDLLEGADEERAYRLTHCRLCAIPCTEFRPLPDGPELLEDELGFPAAVVPWIDSDAHGGALEHANHSATLHPAQSRDHKTSRRKT
jgi:hypothetical protein